jgi:hypothetical protein
MSEVFTREEYLTECRRRAFYMLDHDKLPLVVMMSLLVNLRSHHQTQNHEAVAIAHRLMEQGKLKSAQSVRCYVERFVK